METDLVMGRIPAMECLRAGKRRAVKLHLLASARGLEDLRALAAGIPVRETDRFDLDRIARGGVHQGVILEAEPLPLLDLEEWLDRGTAPDAFAVMLDSIEDPHNFGAIVRSAAALGASAVIFAKDRSAPVSPAAIKAAAGGMEHIDLIQATNLSRALNRLKEAGFWAAALDADAPKTLWDTDLTGRIVLVVGNEGGGIRRLVREQCDLFMSIPMTGAITSLNASVSAAIALAECRRRRPKPDTTTPGD